MRIVTTLMDKVFSDSTPKSFGDELTAAIQKAMSEGQYSCEIDGAQYNFADCGDGSCVIEDKSNKNELTLAKENAKGETILTGVNPAVKSDSPTLKDVVSPRTAGEDSKGNLPAGSTQSDIDVTVEKTAGIVDAEKAGVGKALQSNFSLCIHGFDTEEEANEFFSEIQDMAENNICFSDDELEQIAFSATELKNDVERLMGTEDLQLAYSIAERAEELRAYSILAENAGHDTSDLIEACNEYSEYADDMIEGIFSDMDVNEYFSELTEDEINEYFSELDEVTADVLYSALTDEEENYTFSDVQDICDVIYSEIAEQDELSQSVQEAFSEFSEDEVNEYFSQFNEVEQDAIFSVLDEDENATFSDLNDALAEVNVDLNEMFSDASEDEINEFCENFSEDELDVLQTMMSDEDTNYMYSDFMSYVLDNRTFSDDDLFIFAENMNQLYSAVEDMTSEDTDLAGSILYFSQQMAEISDSMTEQGHDMSDVNEKLISFSEKAAENLDKAGIDPASAIEAAAKEAERKEEKPEKKDGAVDPKTEDPIEKEKEKAERKSAEEPKKTAQKDNCDAPQAGQHQKSDGDGSSAESQLDFSCFGKIGEEGEQKVFSKQQVENSGAQTSINSFLDTPIN
jgi:hypothetical protein